MYYIKKRIKTLQQELDLFPSVHNRAYVRHMTISLETTHLQFANSANMHHQ